MKKTLVIHPKDTSTEFLTPIYEGKDWTVVRDSYTSKSKIRDMLNKHDRIIMLGHGSEKGLGRITIEYGVESFNGFMIDSSYVEILREKEGVYIWCNADKFVKKYSLKGFYTGMIISDSDEAKMFLNESVDYGQILRSNLLFAESIKQSIDESDMVSIAKEIYFEENNAVVDFNKTKLYS